MTRKLLTSRPLLACSAVLSTISALPQGPAVAQTPAAARAPASTAVHPPAPDWTKDLVIYEIATKSFTSPNGPESGTFESLKARMAYLQELGVTGIWLTGHSVSDPKHFYNIWTQYAAIEPDQLDPSLGSPEQFKALIDEAHARGIKVFLDVITHGVMPQSSLVRNHPEWFRGGSWGMADFDWNGGHADLDEYWVKTWTDAVTQYGVDGFRLDVNVYRYDLWARIRRNAAAAGHPIAIFTEGIPITPGIIDFVQKGTTLSSALDDSVFERANDIPKLYTERFGAGIADYGVEVRFSDGTTTTGSTKGDGPVGVKLDGFTPNRVTLAPTVPAGVSELQLSLSAVPERSVKSIVVTKLTDKPVEYPERWVFPQWGAGLPQGQELDVKVRPGAITLYLEGFYGPSSSMQLSSHDNGWSGFPEDKNPYAAEGSRALFGYSMLFTPMIPLFMAGEEFDAGFHPLPNLSPDLHGGENPGKGRWLYGGQLDWNELKRPRHAAMLADVKKMLAIRRQETAILAAEIRGDVMPRLVAVPYTADIKVPAPYMRWTDGAAIVIAANRDAQKDASLTLTIPVDKIGAAARYRVTDLWNGGRAKVYSTAELAAFPLKVRRDKTAGGGVAVIRIEPVK